MANKHHTYSIRVDWTGNQGTGTSAYRTYSRAHEISAPGKPAIAGSSDPVFRGDAARWNPAELLIAALSACHQLWYLHLCADAGIVVVAYSDDASGVEIDQSDGAGQFESVTLRPHAKLTAGSDENIARRLHDAAAGNALSPAPWRSKSITIRPSKFQWCKPIARCHQVELMSVPGRFCCKSRWRLC